MEKIQFFRCKIWIEQFWKHAVLSLSIVNGCGQIRVFAYLGLPTEEVGGPIAFKNDNLIILMKHKDHQLYNNLLIFIQPSKQKAAEF